MDLLIELKNLIAKLQQSKIDYALCGGLAMAIYARPRATLDIDVMIKEGSLSKIQKALAEIGFSRSSGAMSFQGKKIKIKRLTKIDPKSKEHMSVDLLIVTSYTRKAWKSRQTVQWEDGPLNVVSPKGLIFLKSLRKSGQDQDDIDYLRSIIDED